ncbi:M56 family metallopeptidase [Pedobacter sp. ASV28]|uniref:M56 family metallopeptidase n=1 Tax=Pedobacter sp. ASV28 TaxID=2795123 RepID=UPI0018EBEBE8|nr:M56 family metallopeptidase [Pedobacter sp. ASV28]
MSWSHYLLQVNIYLVVFYAFYRLLLTKETYFVLNRVYLICSGIFSLAIPFIQVDWFSKQEISQQIYVQVEQLNQLINQGPVAAEAKSFNWGSIIVLIYLLGVLFFLGRFIIQLIGVKKMFNGLKNGLAFSFWNKKIVADNLPGATTVNHHEDIHIKQLHTFDVLFFESLGILTWFNPIIYLYKATVKSIHEYLADEAAAKFQGDKEAYSMLLLNQAFGVNVNTLTNGFLKKSMIKKRIFMLYKERSRKTAIVKYGIFVPLFALALLLSSSTIRKNEQLLAAADQVPLEDAKATVAEVLNLTPQKSVEVVLAEPIVRFPLPKGTRAEDGINSFYKYLGNTVKYPSLAAENKVQGNLVITFKVIDKKTTDIKIETKLGAGCDEEMVKRIEAYKEGALKDGNYSLKVAFMLQGSSAPFINEKAENKANFISLNTISIVGYPFEPDEVYSFASLENPPKFPGGVNDFYKFLGDNIKYPEEAAKQDIEGNVFVSFIVEKDGSLNEIKIDRGLGYGTDEEAVRILKLSPKWTPGTQNGKIVRVKYNLPIKFSLNKKQTGTIKGIKFESQEGAIKLTGDQIVLRGKDFEDGKSPLYVLDGEILENGRISGIDAKTIETINILKDDSGVALYGEKAKNGVVIITTKNAEKVVTGRPSKKPTQR